MGLLLPNFAVSLFYFKEKVDIYIDVWRPQRASNHEFDHLASFRNTYLEQQAKQIFSVNYLLSFPFI